jgi:hypothetical protein
MGTFLGLNYDRVFDVKAAFPAAGVKGNCDVPENDSL